MRTLVVSGAICLPFRPPDTSTASIQPPGGTSKSTIFSRGILSREVSTRFFNRHHASPKILLLQVVGSFTRFRLIYMAGGNTITLDLHSATHGYTYIVQWTCCPQCLAKAEFLSIYGNQTG